MPDPLRTRAARHGVTATLALIIAAGAGLRLTGIDFGLPAVFNPDEVAIMSRALALAKGDLNPHNFLYPTFYFYVLFAWIGAAFVAGWLSGTVESLQAFQSSFFTDPTAIYLAGRALSVICGLVTVWVVYRLASRLADRRAGLAAAVFLAVAPFAVRDAHYVKHDIPATLTVALAYLAMMRCLPVTQGRPDPLPRAWVVLAGAATGVAFSTHYYTVFLGLPLVFVFAARQDPWPVRVRYLLLATTSAGLAFAALSPFLLVEWRTALSDITANRQIVVGNAALREPWASRLATYAGLLWRDAIGWPIVVLSAGGLAVLWVRQWRLAAWLLLFAVPFFVFITNTVVSSRYLNPVLPLVAVCAGYAISSLAARLAPGRQWVIVVITLGACVPGAALSLTEGRFLGKADTRTMAKLYVEQHLPAGTTVALQPYSVPLAQSRGSLVEALRAHLGDEGRASTKFAIRLALDPYPSPAYRLIYVGDGGLDADKIYVGYGELGGENGLKRLRDLGVEYVAVTRYQVPHPDTVPFLQSLETEAACVQRFSPYRPGTDPAVARSVAPFIHNTAARLDPALERPGPVIELWKVRAVALP